MTSYLTRRAFSRRVCGAVVGNSAWYRGSTSRGADEATHFDLVVRGGTVVDGTGGPAYSADVAVKGDRIARVGTLPGITAKREIRAEGRCVLPGFIDIHTHSDRSLLADGRAESAVRQGATTHVIGNCGSSPAPARRGGGPDYERYGDFLAALRRTGLSINVCGLVGHNAVRTAVMGHDQRAPIAAELEQMKSLVGEALQSGAFGMSTGLVSPPGSLAETGEIIELARVVAAAGGLYASHIRGEAGTLVESVAEAIRIGREAGARVQVSHHKAAGRENWGKTRSTLAMLEEANRQGVAVRTDVYPYRAGSAGLTQLVPPWAHEGGDPSLLARLRDPSQRTRIAREMTSGAPNWPNFFVIDWDDIQIAGVATDKNRRWVGKKIGDLARERGRPGVEACIDLLIEEKLAVRMINFVMDEDEMRRVLAHPLAMIGSDGSAVSPAIETGQPHPRFYGCYPRVLGRYCRDFGLFSLESAVHKMTAMPAEQLKLPDRGLIREGYAADLVLVEFHRVRDTATFENPQQFPEGIPTVIVNGQVVVDNGKHLGTKPGRVLARTG